MPKGSTKKSSGDFRTNAYGLSSAAAAIAVPEPASSAFQGLSVEGRTHGCLKSFVHGIHGCSHSREHIRHLGYFPSHIIVPACAGEGCGATGPVGGGMAAGRKRQPKRRRDGERGRPLERFWLGLPEIVGRVQLPCFTNELTLPEALFLGRSVHTAFSGSPSMAQARNRP